MGRVGPRTPVRDRRPRRLNVRVRRLPGNCTACPHHGAPVGPARGHADNSVGHARSCKRLAPRARMSMMARSRNGSTDEAEDTTAVRLVVQRPGVTANRHGAPRASRPFGRLRRCASRSLDPCSRRASVQLCDEGAPSSLVASVGGTKKTSYSLLSFLLDGGVQIRVLGGDSKTIT